jgi:tetratricopeptide (TPR) repeat protein
VRTLSLSTTAEHQRQLWFDVIYEAHFGDLARVRPLAARLLAALDEPDSVFTLDLAMSRLGYCLYYAGELSLAHSYLTKAFTAGTQKGTRSQAHWCASALAEHSLNAGNISDARYWLSEARDIQRMTEGAHFTSGIDSTAIRLAILEDRADDADQLLLRAEQRFTGLKHARNRAIVASYRARIASLRSTKVDSSTLRVLIDAFPRGRTSLAFDEVVLGLWEALRGHGRNKEAEAIAREYLSSRRGQEPLIKELEHAIQSVNITPMRL